MSGEEVTNDEWRIGDERRAIEDDEQESRASEPDQERAGLRSYRPKESGDKISKTVKTRGFVSLCYRSHPSEVSEGQCDGKGARPCTTTRYSTVTAVSCLSLMHHPPTSSALCMPLSSGE